MTQCYHNHVCKVSHNLPTEAGRMLAKIQGVSNVQPGPTDILIVILIGHFILAHRVIRLGVKMGK